jgi:hypothetical protein
MKNVQYILVILLGFGVSNFQGQEAPGAKQGGSVLLLNGTAHLGTGEMINRSAIVLESGKIVKVMNALTNTINNSEYDTVIDIKDKHVYPGFIAVNSTLGLMEIGAVRATEDFEETGTYNPNVRSIIAYNTDSKITPTIRTNGVLLAQVTPRGGIVSGSSSVVHFDAWNWEDALIKEDIGVHLNWPIFMKSSGWWSSPGASKKSKNYLERTKDINTFFDEAAAYSKASNEEERDLKLESMTGVFTGKKTLYVNVSYVKEINDVINFKRKYKLKNVVIVGGYDSWMVTNRLKENNISVIIQHIHSLPNQPEDDIDLPYKLPKLLHDAGVSYCLQYYARMEQMGTRNLPFVAGTAIAYGLAYEEGVASITLNAAKILGIDNELGSIEVGKNATLFVSEGDALDMRTSNVVVAFIDGRMINLDNHQSRNYNKYKTKYGLE